MGSSRKKQYAEDDMDIEEPEKVRIREERTFLEIALFVFGFGFRLWHLHMFRVCSGYFEGSFFQIFPGSSKNARGAKHSIPRWS